MLSKFRLLYGTPAIICAKLTATLFDVYLYLIYVFILYTYTPSGHPVGIYLYSSSCYIMGLLFCTQSNEVTI